MSFFPNLIVRNGVGILVTQPHRDSHGAYNMHLAPHSIFVPYTYQTDSASHQIYVVDWAHSSYPNHRVVHRVDPFRLRIHNSLFLLSFRSSLSNGRGSPKMQIWRLVRYQQRGSSDQPNLPRAIDVSRTSRHHQSGEAVKQCPGIVLRMPG